MLQSTGPITFSNIAAEFGLPPNKNLGAYRISRSYGALTNLPLDTNIPQSGPIKFSNFYGKALNLIVDFYSTVTSTTRQNAKSQYSNGNVNVVGEFRQAPFLTSGKKVYIHVNYIIGSDNSNQNNVALRTGNWDDNTTLQVSIGPNGQLYGAGGNGGNGYNNIATDGSPGSSALGIEYSGTTIVNSGYIQCGFGGGGGGSFGTASQGSPKGKGGVTNYGAAGGGGGGGAGFPAGIGGLLGQGAYNTSGGTDGSAGSFSIRGSGGSGGSGGGANGGSGGNGGDPNNAPQSSGTAAGSNGYSIIYTSGVTGVTINNFGTIIGDTVTGSVL